MKQSYRVFLLGMSDEDAERRIEEGILDGNVDPDDLRTAEDGLIDDYLFNQLSEEEQQNFDSHFLSSPERRALGRVPRLLSSYRAEERRGCRRLDPSRATYGTSRCP